MLWILLVRFRKTDGLWFGSLDGILRYLGKIWIVIGIYVGVGWLMILLDLLLVGNVLKLINFSLGGHFRIIGVYLTRISLCSILLGQTAGANFIYFSW